MDNPAIIFPWCITAGRTSIGSVISSSKDFQYDSYSPGRRSGLATGFHWALWTYYANPMTLLPNDNLWPPAYYKAEVIVLLLLLLYNMIIYVQFNIATSSSYVKLKVDESSKTGIVYLIFEDISSGLQKIRYIHRSQYGRDCSFYGDECSFVGVESSFPDGIARVQSHGPDPWNCAPACRLTVWNAIPPLSHVFMSKKCKFLSTVIALKLIFHHK